MIPTHVSARRSRFLPGRIALGISGLCLFLCIPRSIAQNSDVPVNREPAAPSAAATDKATSVTDHVDSSPQSARDRANADAEQLSALANQLRDQLQGMNINVFSFGVQEKTEAIQKLVQKIKAEGNER